MSNRPPNKPGKKEAAMPIQLSKCLELALKKTSFVAQTVAISYFAFKYYSCLFHAFFSVDISPLEQKRTFRLFIA